MFQKESYTIPADTSGVLSVKVIQLRRHSMLTLGRVGMFARVVMKLTVPKLLKFRKRRSKSIIIRTSQVFKA
jgi:Ribosomal protein L14p/L23e.